MESLAWLPGQVSHHPRFSTTQHHHGDCNRECGLQCGTLPLRPDGMETPPCATYPDYDGFMAQLCWEPLSDTHNGALGVFCPCVLYGKTYWRLDQQWTQFTIESHRADLAELRDREPDEQERAAIEEFLARTEHEGKLWDDSNFTCEDAFNEKCCSCFMTSCFTLCLCFWDEPCVLRNEVRDRYRISDSICGDCAVSYFCPCASLIQLDREVRAREGQYELRTSVQFRRHQLRVETKQPGLVKPMSYTPSRATSRQFSLHPSNPGASLGNSFSLQPMMSGARRTPNEPINKSKGVTIHITGDETMNISTGTSKNEKNIESCRVVVQNGVASILPTQPHDMSDCPPTTTRTSDAGQVSPTNLEKNTRSTGRKKKFHMLENCAIIEIDRESETIEHDLEKCDTVPTTGNTLESHFLADCDAISEASTDAVEQDSLQECSNTATIFASVTDSLSKSHPISGTSTAVKHSISACDEIKVASVGSLEQHFITECEPPSPHSLDALEEHSMTECETAPPSLTDSAEQHYITECEETSTPISLDDVEQHPLTECDTMATTSDSNTEEHPLTECDTVVTTYDSNIEEHVLAECETVGFDYSEKAKQVEKKRGDPTSRKHSKQAPTNRNKGATKPRRAKRPRKGNTKVVISEKVEQNSLDVTTLTAEQHELADCTTITVQTVKLSTELEQHPLGECTRTSISFPVAAKQHGLPQCTIVTVTSPTISQHAIFECVEEGILSPVSIDQHPLQDCATTPVTSPPPTEQHNLTECEEVPSISEEQEQEQELSYVHDFTDCPIDKRVIDYYDKEEDKSRQQSLAEYESQDRKARQHTFGDCPRTSSVVSLPNTTSFQHALIDCEANVKSKSRSASISNSLLSRRRSSTALKSKVTVGHRLASCPILESLDRNEGDHVHDVSCLTEGLHHKHSSDEIPIVGKGKGKNKDPAPERAPLGKDHKHNVSCLTENLHHVHKIQRSTESASTTESSEGATSSGNQHRRRRLKKKDRQAIVAEELRQEKEYTVAQDGHASARHSDAQVALARVLAAQDKRKKSGQVDGCDDYYGAFAFGIGSSLRVENSGEWFGKKLERRERTLRSCSSPSIF